VLSFSSAVQLSRPSTIRVGWASAGLVQRFSDSATLTIRCDLEPRFVDVNGRNIWTRLAGQHRKGWSLPLHGSPKPRDTKPVLMDFVEAPFVLRGSLPGKLIEMRYRHQAAAAREAPVLRTHVDDRWPLRPARRESPAALNELCAVSLALMMGATSVGQMSSRGSRFGAPPGANRGILRWLKVSK
jgi:hypothetical protein